MRRGGKEGVEELPNRGIRTGYEAVAPGKPVQDSEAPNLCGRGGGLFGGVGGKTKWLTRGGLSLSREAGTELATEREAEAEVSRGHSR